MRRDSLSASSPKTPAGHCQPTSISSGDGKALDPRSHEHDCATTTHRLSKIMYTYTFEFW